MLEKAKAVNDFKKAKDYLVQAQSLDPATGCKRSDETGKRSSEIKNGFLKKDSLF